MSIRIPIILAALISFTIATLSWPPQASAQAVNAADLLLTVREMPPNWSAETLDPSVLLDPALVGSTFCDARLFERAPDAAISFGAPELGSAGVVNAVLVYRSVDEAQQALDRLSALVDSCPEWVFERWNGTPTDTTLTRMEFPAFGDQLVAAHQQYEFGAARNEVRLDYVWIRVGATIATLSNWTLGTIPTAPSYETTVFLAERVTEKITRGQP